ncbi:hypothetical protein AVEN_230469-1 [Araneus ventricosus]|uniref:CCHC-type domain-containing protein n=1 Tax=Araneus ventricosus TaxID=182803 RepID=A0A4Y2J176_ARAVE|nr:hypothetical protein AVEN_230469-1 [Araneus ventricosus]
MSGNSQTPLDSSTPLEMIQLLQLIRLGVEVRFSNSVANQNVNSTQMKPNSKQPRKEGHYDKQNSFRDDSAITINEKRKLYGITHNERGEPKCFNCSNFGHTSRIYSLPKSVLTCRECNETGHKAIHCVANESNDSSNGNLYVRQVGENSEESNSYLKKAKLNNFDNVQALIDTVSSCCLLKISVAQKFKLKPQPAVNKLYSFANQWMPALTSIGRIKDDIEVDNVKDESISIYVVTDGAQSVHHQNLIFGRAWLDLPHIGYTKIGKKISYWIPGR